MNDSEIQDSTPEEVERMLAAATSAAPLLAAMPLAQRADGMLAVADALDAHGEELRGLAAEESALTAPRLTGELRRTVVQLRLFADVAREGAFLDVRIDAADPDFVLGPRPDLRRYLVPRGPVLNFAASNFPFAFSVAGGDSAAALAAGCPLIVKAHPGHPRLSVATAELVAAALDAQGFPEGTFALVRGQEQGVTMLRDPRIRAATFTGSFSGGQFLASVAADRPTPIPFFGELSSVNPVFVTADALAARRDEIASGFVTSIAGSAGQLCTKPGFLFVPYGDEVTDRIGELAAGQGEHRMLTPSIAAGYAARREAVLGSDARVLSAGSVREDDKGETWVTPTVVAVDLKTLESERERLLDEAFGPLSVVVEYSRADPLPETAAELFPGNLTGSVHVAPGEDSPSVRALLATLADTSGRVLINGWPTGVAVTPAMQHGGPFPATTDPSGTSVGTAAIARLLRPVAFQNTPQNLLPEPLLDDNPWGVPQARTSAGESAEWGHRAGADAVPASR